MELQSAHPGPLQKPQYPLTHSSSTWPLHTYTLVNGILKGITWDCLYLITRKSIPQLYMELLQTPQIPPPPHHNPLFWDLHSWTEPHLNYASLTVPKSPCLNFYKLCRGVTAWHRNGPHQLLNHLVTGWGLLPSLTSSTVFMNLDAATVVLYEKSIVFCTAPSKSYVGLQEKHITLTVLIFCPDLRDTLTSNFQTFLPLHQA